MTHTIEDALEILGGLKERPVNIRIDSGETNLIRSLARQVFRGTALTDRQLDLAIKKIEKYRQGLEKNSLDVDHLVTLKPLRLPLRKIDRTQMIFFETTPDKKIKTHIKFVFSKKFAEVWLGLVEKLNNRPQEEKGEKILSFNEQDLYHIVTDLQPLGFVITEEVQETYNKIDEILGNPNNHVPYVDFVDGQLVLKNINNRCKEYLDTEFTGDKDSDFLVFLGLVKNCGIYHKNHEIIKKITEISPNNLIKNILISTETRFRINPQEHSVDAVFDILDTLKQWPLLIMVDDVKDTISVTKSLCETLIARIDYSEITVFFRLQNGNPDNEQFNQFVRDNHLNNYIDSNTKVVFISKNRIPKPLFNADWKPKTALVLSNYEFGKTSAYLNNFSSVYYYNNSVSLRHNKIKGANEIVQL